MTAEGNRQLYHRYLDESKRYIQKNFDESKRQIPLYTQTISDGLCEQL